MGRHVKYCHNHIASLKVEIWTRLRFVYVLTLFQNNTKYEEVPKCLYQTRRMNGHV
jgi:hypothetical protein